MKKILEWIKKHIVTFVKSLVIGATLRVPGMSGGTTAIILGIYDKLLSAVNNFFKNIKQNIVFLAVFALGGGLAFLAFNSLISKITTNFPAISAYFFVGIILFGIPALIKESGISYKKPDKNSTDGLLFGKNKRLSGNTGINDIYPCAGYSTPSTNCGDSNSNIPDDFDTSYRGPNVTGNSSVVNHNQGITGDSKTTKNSLTQAAKTQSPANPANKPTMERPLALQILLDLVPFLCGVAAVVVISLLQNNGILDGSSYTGFGGLVFNMLVGFFAGVALVLPGLSFTYFLTVIGLMDTVSKSISLSSVDAVFLMTFGVGAVIGLVATAKVLGSLIEKRKRGTYLCVIGFLIGSVVMLVTDQKYIPAKSQIFFCALFFVLGAALILGATYLANRFAAKRQEKEESAGETQL